MSDIWDKLMSSFAVILRVSHSSVIKSYPDWPAQRIHKIMTVSSRSAQSTAPPSGKTTCPSPTPSFDARKLRNGNNPRHLYSCYFSKRKVLGHWICYIVWLKTIYIHVVRYTYSYLTCFDTLKVRMFYP